MSLPIEAGPAAQDRIASVTPRHGLERERDGQTRFDRRHRPAKPRKLAQKTCPIQ
jgi:hypothetical protein